MHKRGFTLLTEPVHTSALLAGIGCNLTVSSHQNADIEFTLCKASVESLSHLDFRILSLLVQWVGIHSPYVNVPRLIRFLKDETEQTKLFWQSIGQWKQPNRKWKKTLHLINNNNRFDLLPVGTDFQIQRKGEDERFTQTQMRVPKGLLREREGDVLSIQQMINYHRTYRNRVKFGVCLRADLWSVLEEYPDMLPATLAKQVGCAFASAWEVKQDFEIWRRIGV